MEFDANIEHLRMAFWQVIITSGPILGIALGVGLAIGIVQAATTINDMTLSFVPTLFFVLGGFALLSVFMLLQLSYFFASIFTTLMGPG